MNRTNEPNDEKKMDFYGLIVYFKKSAQFFFFFFSFLFFIKEYKKVLPRYCALLPNF